MLRYTSDNLLGAYLLPTTDGTNGQVLTTDGAGNVTFADAGGSAGGNTGIDFDDNVKARFGTGNDLEIYHNGSSSIIENTSAGQYLRIRSAGGIQFTTSGTENALVGIQDNKVGLYYDGSEKLETTSTGVQTTGTVNVNGAYTLPTSDGTNGQVLTTDGAGAVTFADAGGGGADLYAAETTSSTDPTASGTRSIAIGSSASATGSQSIAIGGSATTSGLHSVSIGGGTTDNTNDFSVAVGYFSRSSGEDATAVGRSSKADGLRSTALGTNADGNGSYSVAVGKGSLGYGSYSISIGADTQANYNYSTALGHNSSGQSSRADAIGSIALNGSRTGGTDSFAAAIANNTSSYGASGANSIAIGDRAKATAANSVAIGGYGSVASSASAIAFGYQAESTDQYSTALGYGSKADARYAVALGQADTHGVRYRHAYGGDRFSSTGDAQAGLFILLSDTTDATAEAMTTDNGTASTDNQIILPNNGAYFFSGTCVARESAASGTDMGAWEFKGCIRREANAGTTTLVSSTIDEFSAPTGWSIDLVADTTNGGLKIEVTGVASTNIRWVATVNTSEVTYA